MAFDLGAFDHGIFDGSAGDLDLSLGSIFLASVGEVQVSGSLGSTLADLSLSGSGICFTAANLAVTLGDLSVSGGGTIPIVANSKRRVARYREPGIRYRQAGNGYRRFIEEASVTSAQPSRRGWGIRVYDRADVLRYVFSSNVQRSQVVDWSFEELDTGCGQFDLTLAKPHPLIDHGWRVDFHLWNDPKAWYSGFVQGRPALGSTSRPWKFSGFGWFACADDVLITQVFEAGISPSRIADFLANNMSAGTIGRVRYSPAKISQSNYKTAGQVKFLRSNLKDCMKLCCDLAGGWQWGVDAQRQIFFRPVLSTVTDDARWWVGKHLETFVSDEDSSKVKNQVYIKLGKVRTDLSPGHYLFNTNFIEDPLNDGPSQNKYGLKSKIYSSASTLSPTDATRAAGADLMRLKEPIVKAKVTGIEFSGVRIEARGKAIVTGKGGVTLTLPKKKVRLKCSQAKIDVSVELGDLDVSAGSLLSIVAQAQAEESLARQVSQTQF